MNLLPAEVLPDRLRLPFGEIPFDTAGLPASLAGNDLIIAGIRPEHLDDVRLLDDEHRRRGVTFKAPVDVLEWLGDEQLAYVPFESPERIHRQLTELQQELDSESDRTQLIVKLGEASEIREGEEIELWFDPRNLHLFDPVTTENVTRERTLAA